VRLLTFRHRPEQRKRTRVVVAGDYRQFVNWCREQGVSPGRHDVVYATPERLRGLNDVEVCRTGSWYERDDLTEIVETLRFVNRRSE
jgi:hypothetical protein